jgi:uncharacterized SAM-binding protein YcdF (DUF218 family)
MPPAPYRYDAVIVLANMMDRHGRLNAETRARVDLACQAVRSGDAPLLVTCGSADRLEGEMTIAEAMRRDALDVHGLPDAAVETEPASRDTVGDAVFTKRHIAAPRHWSRVLVVTSAYHLARAIEIFNFVYGPLIEVDGRAAASDDNALLREGEARSLAAFQATFAGVAAGDDAAIFERLRTRHPLYNGEVFQAI